MSPIRVLVADDHELVRAGFRSLLQAIDGVEVVAEADDGLRAVELVRTHRPNLVLMDIAMRGLNGLEATSRIAREFPQVRVIILSMHKAEEYVLQALRNGASGYLLKNATPAELELAVRTVSRGDTYLTPAISRQVIDGYVRRLTPGETSADLLTPRQREILQLIAEGLTTKAIADRLHVSVKTVETHRSQLMKRLNIRDVAGLVRYAIRIGLIQAQ
ncbi:MAG TPA: response regulator transcription factor [Nitrospiria bacterium]|nr:response regulator transcription factor [Nitrospiria bacterium]